MTPRYLILLLLLPTLISACSDTRKKKYSITTYFTSFDSSGNSMGNHSKKFKYSYEEYNADSNLIYQELYATPDNFGNMWGKLFERTKFYYDRKEKIKSEIEFGISFRDYEKGKKTDKFEYKEGLLSKWFSNGKLVEEYQYDNRGNLAETRVANVNSVPEYYRFTYENGLKTKFQYFVADTTYLIDTFIYDKNKKLVQKISFNGRGKKTDRRVFIRNELGQIVEEKWRNPFEGWRMRNDGKIIEAEFYQTNKYYYDSKRSPIRAEFYEVGKLMVVYEFTYD